MQEHRNNMLISFRFANFMSFKNSADFSMSATYDKTNEKGGVVNTDGNRILKIAGIYGANGSGKSNFLLALKYMQFVVVSSSDEKHVHLAKDNYFKLDSSSSEKASYFEAVFYSEGNRYRYGFEVNGKKILSEWLFTLKSSRETKLFTREGGDVSVGKTFSEGNNKKSRVKSDELFVTAVANDGGLQAKRIVSWFAYTRVLSGIKDSPSFTHHVLLQHGEDDRLKILNILKRFDTFIDDIYLIDKRTNERYIHEDWPKTGTSMFSIFKKQNKYVIAISRKAFENNKPVGSKEFLLSDESHGTQRLVALAGLIIDVLEHGYPMLVDEIEAKLHPLVTKRIVEIFSTPELNYLNSQIVFTTHDVNLLSSGSLRRDQIWFTEKDKYGSSHIYSLSEYKNKPRKDASFEKNYVEGRYGAIPYLGDINDILAK